MKKETCSKCGDGIDKSDAQERFTTFTRHGVNAEKNKQRGILCNKCTLDLDIFLLQSGDEK
jgi:hypothetical protein